MRCEKSSFQMLIWAFFRLSIRSGIGKSHVRFCLSFGHGHEFLIRLLETFVKLWSDLAEEMVDFLAEAGRYAGVGVKGLAYRAGTTRWGLHRSHLEEGQRSRAALTILTLLWSTHPFSDSSSTELIGVACHKTSCPRSS